MKEFLIATIGLFIYGTCVMLIGFGLLGEMGIWQGFLAICVGSIGLMLIHEADRSHWFN